jgi:hypothetical protein
MTAFGGGVRLCQLGSVGFGWSSLLGFEAGRAESMGHLNGTTHIVQFQTPRKSTPPPAHLHQRDAQLLRALRKLRPHEARRQRVLPHQPPVAAAAGLRVVEPQEALLQVGELLRGGGGGLCSCGLRVSTGC